MTNAQVIALGRKWQRKLRLMDWDITFVPTKELVGDLEGWRLWQEHILSPRETGHNLGQHEFSCSHY